MEYYHLINNIYIDFAEAISQHSADESVVYKMVDKQPLYLGLYFPPDFNPSCNNPIFVFIHGGSWENKKTFDDQSHWQGDYLGYLARYYADKGFVCASIDYRLVKDKGQTDGFGLIDSYEDCCDAMDYILHHADEYGIDTQNLFLLGESAGGYLAGAVATFCFERCYSLKTVFLVNPITDLTDPIWYQYVPEKSTHIRLAQFNMKEKAESLSPLYQLSAETCPVVLIHGDSDTCVHINHSKAFYNRMSSLSIECDLHILNGTNHAFLLAEYTKELNACQTGISIINQYILKNEP